MWDALKQVVVTFRSGFSTCINGKLYMIYRFSSELEEMHNFFVILEINSSDRVLDLMTNRSSTKMRTIIHRSLSRSL